MNETQIFSIGQVARLFHVSPGTLRHYEQAGLLAPERIDPDTGYRYYSYRQFEVLNTIRYLRVLDMPLDEIADFLHNREIDRIREKLLNQKEIIVKKRQELESIERKIDNRLRRLADARDARLGQILSEEMPPCRMVWIRDSLKPRGYLDLERSIRRLEAGQKQSVAFLGKVGLGILPEQLQAGRFDRYDLVFLLLDEEDDYEGNVEEYPAGSCALIRFQGSHREAPAHYERLLEYIRRQGLAINGFSREITLIDDGMTADPREFVTEIRIPVK